ncbi:MAG: Tol-Pal system beta propeller repeat protein TolB [Gammaproteobacteria bacterium]|nr:Tol-Pal system beta propeller repeat protein TolB [Gammaproteobacteria bacterium]
MKLRRVVFYVPVLVVMLCCHSLSAELRIEVTKGVDNAVRIAVVPFEWRGRGILPEQIADIVSSDLLLSGRFDTLDVDSMLSLPHVPDEVFFRDWRLLKAEYLVIGYLHAVNQDEATISPAVTRLRLHFELYNVFRQSVEVIHEIEGEIQDLRDMAHYVSDVVYEKLTGIEGAFLTRILYVTDTGPVDNREYRLNVADADGKRAAVILKSREPLLSVIWSPDGRKIAYVSFEKDSKPAIYIRDMESGETEQITNFKGLNGAPAWSPDGKSLAMVLSRDGNPEIYIMDLEDRRLRRITRHYGIDTEPSWSPDGTSLIFTSNRGGKPQIYKITLANLEIERLTFEGDYNARARFLPDGKSLIMVHRRKGIYHIALLELTRGRLTVLTETALDESPSIAPNGSMLIYATRYGGRGVLAAVSIDGGVKFRLPSSEGNVREPAWSPKKHKKFEANILNE